MSARVSPGSGMLGTREGSVPSLCDSKTGRMSPRPSSGDPLLGPGVLHIVLLGLCVRPTASVKVLEEAGCIPALLNLLLYGRARLAEPCHPAIYAVWGQGEAFLFLFTYLPCRSSLARK